MKLRSKKGPLLLGFLSAYILIIYSCHSLYIIIFPIYPLVPLISSGGLALIPLLSIIKGPILVQSFLLFTEVEEAKSKVSTAKYIIN